MLNLTGNFIYSEEMDTLIWSINSMKHLMYLNLSINQIGSEGLAMIGDVLPETIQHLNFSESPFILAFQLVPKSYGEMPYYAYDNPCDRSKFSHIYLIPKYT